MQAQKIGEIKANGHETLWQFLGQVPSSFEMQIFYAIILFGLLGMLANYTRQWLQNDTAGWCFIRYFWDEHPRRTLLSLATCWGTGITGIMSGVFETSGGEFVGWINVIWICFMNGFTFDAVTNKGAAPAAQAEVSDGKG